MTADDLREEANMPMRPITKGRMLKEAAAEIERLTAENEKMRAAILFARSVAEMDGLAQWVEHFDKALGASQQDAKT